MLHWANPWTINDVVNVVFLILATALLVAVPLFYIWRANLRDPLARAVLAGTSVTGLAFIARLIATFGHHFGWNVEPVVSNWITRVIYVSVALGELTFLLALLGVLRDHRNEKDQS